MPCEPFVFPLLHDAKHTRVSCILGFWASQATGSCTSIVRSHIDHRCASIGVPRQKHVHGNSQCHICTNATLQCAGSEMHSGADAVCRREHFRLAIAPHPIGTNMDDNQPVFSHYFSCMSLTVFIRDKSDTDAMLLRHLVAKLLGISALPRSPTSPAPLEGCLLLSLNLCRTSSLHSRGMSWHSRATSSSRSYVDILPSAHSGSFILVSRNSRVMAAGIHSWVHSGHHLPFRARCARACRRGGAASSPLHHAASASSPPPLAISSYESPWRAQSQACELRHAPNCLC